jgi:hypothetical protein
VLKLNQALKMENSQAKREKYQSIMRKADFLTEAEQTFLSEVARKGLDGVDPFA